jgi:predicted ATPase
MGGAHGAPGFRGAQSGLRLLLLAPNDRDTISRTPARVESIMLKTISLENFRAFKKADIELSWLNVFVGPNNSGKSSIISTISLIAQNAHSSSQRFSLALNGPHTQLGTFYETV